MLRYLPSGDCPESDKNTDKGISGNQDYKPHTASMSKRAQSEAKFSMKYRNSQPERQGAGQSELADLHGPVIFMRTVPFACRPNTPHVLHPLSKHDVGTVPIIGLHHPAPPPEGLPGGSLLVNPACTKSIKMVLLK